MNRRATILGIIMVVACGGAAFAVTNPANELRAAVKEYRQALVKKDAATLDKIWTDDYTFINAHGRIGTKAERLAELKSGATSLDSITHEEEPQVRVHGNVGIVRSDVTISGIYSGRKTSGLFRSTHVWLFDGTRWRLMLNQLTAVEK